MARLVRLTVLSLVLWIVVGCASTAEAEEFILEDIGPGWSKAIDVELDRAAMQMLAGLTGEAATGESIDGWLRTWRNVSREIWVIAIEIGGRIDDPASGQRDLAASLENDGFVLTSAFSTIPYAAAGETEEDGATVLAVYVPKEAFLLAFLFIDVSADFAKVIVERQVASVPAYDDEEDIRPLMRVLSGVAFVFFLALAYRRYRKRLIEVRSVVRG